MLFQNFLYMETPTPGRTPIICSTPCILPSLQSSLTLSLHSSLRLSISHTYLLAPIPPSVLSIHSCTSRSFVAYSLRFGVKNGVKNTCFKSIMQTCYGITLLAIATHAASPYGRPSNNYFPCSPGSVTPSRQEPMRCSVN